MTMLRTIALFIISALSLPGCTTLYKTNAVYSPMLEKKGDLNISAALSTSGSGLLNVNAAYAISDRAGLLVNGMYHTYREKTTYWAGNSTSDDLNIYSVELAPGFNTPLSADGNWHLQWYGGAGWGDTKVNGSGYTEDPLQPEPYATANFYNFFMQPGIFLSKKNIQLGFDIRANYVNMYDVTGQLYERFDWWDTEYIYTNDANLNFMLIEPNVTFKVGGEKMKAVFQMGVTIPTLNADDYYAVNSVENFTLPIKMVFGVGYTFKKKEAGE
jgi:uncharacterized protein YodC (DUF2158 family)